MLDKLFIKNFVLIDSSEVSFHRGLNVITGETGAGKSVILSALSFLLGDRADSSIIRQEADKATVEAIFSLDAAGKDVAKILEEAGIEHEDCEALILRREMSLANKSRTFINNQSAHVSVLKKLTPYLVEFSGQHAHLALLEEEIHRETLDTFAETQSIIKAFQKAYEAENALKREIEQIESTKDQRVQEIERVQKQIEEINESKLQEGEEDSLFQEIRILLNQEELMQKLGELVSALDGQTAQISRQKAQLERLTEVDPALKDIATSFKTAEAELQEAGYELKRYHSKLEFRPDTLERNEKRLNEITHLKRKYGASISEIEAAKNKLIAKLQELENQDFRLDELKAKAAHTQEEVEVQARKLSEKRALFAQKLSKAVTQEIRSFNMPNAIFEVILTACHRCATGDEKIEFYLTPNLGEKRMLIQEAASGGELARLHLSLQMVLRDKGKKATILFDEIDANIGGETATLVGHKLQLLGKSLQLITVTHFAQVATSGDAHFCISKSEKAGRTHSYIEELTTLAQRQEEITRMLGGKNINELLVATGQAKA